MATFVHRQIKPLETTGHKSVHFGSLRYVTYLTPEECGRRAMIVPSHRPLVEFAAEICPPAILISAGHAEVKESSIVVSDFVPKGLKVGPRFDDAEYLIDYLNAWNSRGEHEDYLLHEKNARRLLMMGENIYRLSEEEMIKLKPAS